MGALGNVVTKALRYSLIWKVEGPRPNEMNEFFQSLVFTQLLREKSTRSSKIMFLGIRAPPVRRADNLTAICEPIVYTVWILDLLQPYRAPRPDTGIVLLCFFINI
jgi:hypothetical protein